MAKEQQQKKKPVRLDLMRSIKDGGRVVAPVGIGALLSEIGAAGARRLSNTAGGYLDEGGFKGAAVKAVAGSLLAGIALGIYAKVTSPAKAATMAPYVFGGALGFPLVTAFGGMVVDYAESLIGQLMGDGKKSSSTPAGAYADIGRGLQGRLSAPAGAYADIGRGLQGRLSAPAGWGEDSGAYFSKSNMASTRLAPGGGPRRL